MLSNHKYPVIRTFIGILLVTVLSLVTIAAPVRVSALAASDWQAGRIIDDDIFTDYNSMSVSDIQAFLNAKVPSCDTNGSLPISSGSSTTRAEWAAGNNGQAPPYTCLRDFYEVPKTQPGLVYSSWRSHTASNQASINTSNNRVEYADINGDGKDEPVLVSLAGTASGMIEFHVWNNDMQSWQTTNPIISNQPVVNPVNNEVLFADINGDGKDEPVLVGLSGTGSGMVEFHVWNNDMQTWFSHTASNQPAIDPTKSRVVFGDPDGDKVDNAILENLTGSISGKVELNVWNNGFSSWSNQIVTNQASVDPSKNEVVFADVNGDGKQVPILIGLTGTQSGTVEFHIWNAGAQTWLAHLASNQSSVDPTSNEVVFADVNGNTRQEPVLVGLNNTGSSKVEFHIWDPGIPASNYGGSAIPAGAKSAAQLIWDAAQANKISPKVLLTTIQKESAGPLTVDDWPFKSQYAYAMGAHCPDSGPGGSANCDPNYAGFSIQISESAALFRYYLDNMSQPWWPYKTVGDNNVLYNPNSACGSTDVSIITKATAALYTYTPYQPNQAALNNLYGDGDGCSAYGNRNFWRIYNTWFGDSTKVCMSSETPNNYIARMYNPSNYKHFYTAYSCEIKALASTGYGLEGVAFYETTASSPDAVVVHRLYNPSTGQHLWVTTQSDINSAIQYSGYRYEGVAFYAVKPETPGAVVVHRLYNPKTYEHLWVTTQDEINVDTQKAGYVYEGVAYYAAPAP